MPLSVRGIAVPEVEIEQLWPIEIPDDIPGAIRAITKAQREDLDWMFSDYLSRHAEDIDTRITYSFEFRLTFGKPVELEARIWTTE